VDGKIVEIRIKLIRGFRPSTGNKLKDFEVFLENYVDKIVQKWIDYFLFYKDVEFERINNRIK
jgi:hypothetical protein